MDETTPVEGSAETTVEHTPEPTSEPPAEPTADDMTKHTAEAMTKHTAEAMTKHTAEAMTKHTAEAMTKHTAEAVTKPSAECTAMAITDPTAEPKAELTSEPTEDKDSEAPASDPVFIVNLHVVPSHEINFFMEQIDKIHARPHNCVPKMPAKLTSYLFVGGYGDANYIPGLKKRGITHVLNCASVSHYGANPYPPDSGVVSFAQFSSEDRSGYNILSHFDMAQRFVNEARAYGGRVLVHCAVGVNRSCSICLAYLMEEEKMDLLAAMELLASKRGTVPSNRFFRLKLIKFAGERGLLKYEQPTASPSEEKTGNK